jgi:hypothetical protein
MVLFKQAAPEGSGWPGAKRANQKNSFWISPSPRRPVDSVSTRVAGQKGLAEWLRRH